jgi:hypothetical protein
MKQQRQFRWFTLGRGLWLRRLGYVVIAYGLAEVVFGTDKAQRFVNAWYIFAVAGVAFFLASQLRQRERPHGAIVEAGASILPAALILLVLTGALHQRSRVVSATVQRFHLLAIPKEYAATCRSGAACLLFDPGGSTVRCYDGLEGLAAKRVDVRVVIRYAHFRPYGFEVLAVRNGEAWRTLSELLDWQCFNDRDSGAALRQELQFSYWRI